MKNFKDSFNIIFGTSHVSIDLFDNPYIKFNVYEIDQNLKPKLSKKIKLRQCHQTDFLEFIEEASV